MSRPDPVAALDKAIATAGTVDESDPTFDELGLEAAKQLRARLQSGEKLPGTDLMKIVASYFKAQEEVLRNQPEEEVTFTLVELLTDVNLPAERRTELLQQEREFLVSQLHDIDKALES